MGLWDSVTGFFSDLGDFFSGKDFFEAAGYAWNDMMKLAADVLTKNPSSGTYKDVWENISTIYTTLNVIVVSLLCIFFLYGFCRDSCDLHADLTFERTIKMFIRLIITSNVMSMALTYMSKFFTWGKNLTSAILGENKLSMVYDFDGAKVYERITGADFGTMTAFLTSILFFLFTVVCGFIVVMTVLNRILKKKELPLAASAEEVIYSATQMLAAERRNKNRLGKLADMPVYSIPYPQIKKIAALKNHIWGL